MVVTNRVADPDPGFFHLLDPDKHFPDPQLWGYTNNFIGNLLEPAPAPKPGCEILKLCTLYNVHTGLLEV